MPTAAFADSVITSGLVPSSILRVAIRSEIKDRISTESRGTLEDIQARKLALYESLRTRDIIEEADAANDQHYEVETDFFVKCLGENVKYSGCLYEGAGTKGTLEEAEERMLGLYVERAEVREGMKVLDLGCGWGSCALWVARKVPGVSVVAISNSRSHRAYIEGKARAYGLKNLEIVTANVQEWEAEGESFDRVLSVELFEHVKNYEKLMAKISRWLKPGGKLFVHIFGHRELAYEYGREGWMARHFFRNGNMLSGDFLLSFQRDLKIQKRWCVNGKHYAKTCEDWLAKQRKNKKEVVEALEKTYGVDKWKWYYRWEVFFMACAELFAWDNGNSFGVFHYLFEKPGNMPGYSMGKDDTY